MKNPARILVVALALGASLAAAESHIAHADEFEETHPQTQPTRGDHESEHGEYNERHEGAVKWFDAVWGWGVITSDDGQDVFVHHGAVERVGIGMLTEGRRVSFELVDGPLGPTALQVRLAL